MGFFKPKPKPKQEINVENLMSLKEGMPVKDAVALIGKPQFVMDSADAFKPMGFVPAWAIGKQNWVYKTPNGDFQLIVQDKETVAELKFIQGLIEKMKENGKT